MTLATDFSSAARNVPRGGWLSATVVSILADVPSEIASEKAS